MKTALRIIKLVLLVVCSVLLASCLGGGGSYSAPAGGGTNVIGSSGGTASSGDGSVTIQVPAGALATATTITITILPSTANTPQGNIGNVFDLGPEGTAFSLPVSMSVKYDPTLIPQGIAESTLTLAYVSGLTWIDIPTTVDTVNKLLIGQITHFSTYGITTPTSSKLPYGSLIGTFNGVNVYSNGCTNPSNTSDPNCLAVNHRTYPNTENTNNVGGYNSGLQWQCVELVNRYYYQVYGKDIRVGLGNAKDYWTLASQKGLDRYANGGSVPPQIGDIIVSQGNGLNTGHVAIVKSVSPSELHLAEQNWLEDIGDFDQVLKIEPGNNVDAFGPAHPVTGWLRLSSNPP